VIQASKRLEHEHGEIRSDGRGLVDHRAAAAEQATLRTGSPWRDLPERYGPYTMVYHRYNRWAKAGVWLRIFEHLAEGSPDSLHLIDSSIIRAHQHAAGGKKGARITPLAVLVED
jgi:transposase